jgi:hypothetical protein
MPLLSRRAMATKTVYRHRNMFDLEPRHRRTVDVANDEPFALPETVICCDCGAAHRVEGIVRHGRIWVVFNRNARSSAATRRQRRYPFERRTGGVPRACIR